jgi:adenosylhomocysteinase
MARSIHGRWNCAANILLAGKRFVVAGAQVVRAGFAPGEGMGAIIIVTEVDPLKALEAVMDGFSHDDGRAARSAYAHRDRRYQCD